MAVAKKNKKVSKKKKASIHDKNSLPVKMKKIMDKMFREWKDSK